MASDPPDSQGRWIGTARVKMTFGSQASEQLHRPQTHKTLLVDNSTASQAARPVTGQNGGREQYYSPHHSQILIIDHTGLFLCLKQTRPPPVLGGAQLSTLRQCKQPREIVNPPNLPLNPPTLCQLRKDKKGRRGENVLKLISPLS